MTLQHKLEMQEVQHKLEMQVQEVQHKLEIQHKHEMQEVKHKSELKVKELEHQLSLQLFSQRVPFSKSETEKDIQRNLAVGIDKTSIRNRPGSGGKGNDYISSSDVIRNMNEIFGFNGWKDSYEEKEFTENLSAGE